MRNPEYDDGYDSAESFERAGADRPEDMEPEEPNMPTYGTDDLVRIANNMQNFGGHFAAAIGRALVVADSGNQQRLAQAFPELFEKYFRWPL